MKRHLEDNFSYTPNKRRKIHFDYINNNNNNKINKRINNNITNKYICCIHDNDQLICNIYDCVGIKSKSNNTYNVSYIG